MITDATLHRLRLRAATINPPVLQAELHAGSVLVDDRGQILQLLDLLSLSPHALGDGPRGVEPVVDASRVRLERSLVRGELGVDLGRDLRHRFRP